MTLADKIRLGYYLCVALGILLGMIIMAIARVERGDLEPPDDINNFDFWIDD